MQEPTPNDTHAPIMMADVAAMAGNDRPPVDIAGSTGATGSAVALCDDASLEDGGPTGQRALPQQTAPLEHGHRPSPPASDCVLGVPVQDAQVRACRQAALSIGGVLALLETICLACVQSLTSASIHLLL